MSEHSSNLWQQDDFLKLWFGQTISGFGSRFSGLALPLIAISLLGATPGELGLLEAAGGVAWWFVGPFIGAGIDRMHRRPILIAAELGRGMDPASIPLAVLFGYLHIEQLYAVALLIGLLSAWFDTAYQSYLPSLVEPEHLIEGNSKLNVSNSAADVAGPGMAGLVIQTIGASVAIALDAFSFLVSGISLISHPQTRATARWHNQADNGVGAWGRANLYLAKCYSLSACLHIHQCHLHVLHRDGRGRVNPIPYPCPSFYPSEDWPNL